MGRKHCRKSWCIMQPFFDSVIEFLAFKESKRMGECLEDVDCVVPC